jgi:hypothetical protein
MSITARNKEVLELFNHLLHDLYLEVPEGGFKVQDNELCLDLTDRDHCIHSGLVVVYRVCVERVTSIQTQGDVRDLPGNEAQLNEIKFNPKEKLVMFECVHPFKIICKVEQFRLRIDEIPSRN